MKKILQFIYLDESICFPFFFQHLGYQGNFRLNQHCLRQSLSYMKKKNCSSNQRWFTSTITVKQVNCEIYKFILIHLTDHTSITLIHIWLCFKRWWLLDRGGNRTSMYNEILVFVGKKSVQVCTFTNVRNIFFFQTYSTSKFYTIATSAFGWWHLKTDL